MSRHYRSLVERYVDNGPCTETSRRESSGDSKTNYLSRVDYPFLIETRLSRAVFLWGDIDHGTMHSESPKLVILDTVYR